MVAMNALSVLGMVDNAWRHLHPQLIPWTDQSPVDVRGDDVLAFLSFAQMLLLTTLLPVAVATFALGVSALGPGPGRSRAAVVLGVSLLAVVVAPWWVVIDHTGDGTELVEPGPGYWLVSASVLLLLLVAVVLVAYLMVRPLAVRPPEVAALVPAGWYPDPYGTEPWRWWDGRAWAGGDPPTG